MDKLIFTRFEKIYSSRKRALEKLDSISRYYAEMVTIRYKNGNSFEVLLALYQSEKKGDYVISFDSAVETQNSGKTYTVIKTNDSDPDIIALNSINPLERDIAIVKSSSGIRSFYLYHNSEWESLSMSVKSSESISLEVDDGVLMANIKTIDCGYL